MRKRKRETKKLTAELKTVFIARGEVPDASLVRGSNRQAREYECGRDVEVLKQSIEFFAEACHHKTDVLPDVEIIHC